MGNPRETEPSRGIHSKRSPLKRDWPKIVHLVVEWAGGLSGAGEGGEVYQRDLLRKPCSSHGVVVVLEAEPPISYGLYPQPIRGLKNSNERCVGGAYIERRNFDFGCHTAIQSPQQPDHDYIKAYGMHSLAGSVMVQPFSGFGCHAGPCEAWGRPAAEPGIPTSAVYS